jgi:ActR/RegA family two-component response regulator
MEFRLLNRWRAPFRRASRSEPTMQTHRPQLLVVDDDRAVLTLVGTGVTCFDVLRALRDMRPQCEVVLTTGFASLDEAIDAAKRNIHTAPPGDRAAAAELNRRLLPPDATPLVQVEREHIVRTLEQVHGNKAVAARMLGISRRAFYRQLERHGLHHRIPMSTRRADAAPAAE